MKITILLLTLLLILDIGYFLKIYRTESKFAQHNVKKSNSYATILNFQPSEVSSINFYYKIKNKIKYYSQLKKFSLCLRMIIHQYPARDEYYMIIKNLLAAQRMSTRNELLLR